MARNFNSNQNRHIYVVKKYSDTVDSTSDTGTITLKTAQFKGNVDKEIYFVYKGADTVLCSDRIQFKNLDYVKAVKAEDLRVPFKSQIITLDSDVNKGAPVSGQDYILRVVLRQWIGMSDKDLYFKEAAVHATSSMSAADFYAKMVEQLNLAFSREIGASKDSNPYLQFEVISAATNVYDPATKETVSVSAGIKITEKEQPWTLGLEQQLPVLFEAQPTTIYTDGDDYVWGKVYDATTKKADVVVGETGRGNGHDIADLEYFAMGERGDQYRMVGWPNIIPTTYLVEPDKEYNVLELHHAFTDDGISSYRSEKDITIVSTDASVIDSITDAIKTATGIEADKLVASSGAKTNSLTTGEDDTNEKTTA